MMEMRNSKDRGNADRGWLQSFHTFSFADYYDEKHMGFRVLRVINEDFIQAKGGFGTHPHRDMEIITYIVSGVLKHQDSMGNGTLIYPGEVQRMSAGTGVMHSEFNPSTEEKTHLLQIWILPNKKNISPSYEQKSYATQLENNDLVLVASSNGEQGSVTINQDVKIYVLKSAINGEKTLNNLNRRSLWIQVVRGNVRCESNESSSILQNGDGAKITDIDEITFKWENQSEFLIFDLP